MTDQNAITVGSIINLRHIGTNNYLKAFSTKYPPPSESGQYMVVATSVKGDDSDWKVEGEFGARVPDGEPIRDLDIIRLQHCKSRRYLHSHSTEGRYEIPLPGQEVTAFDNDGGGDENDNWRIHIGEGEIWVPGVPIKLEHVKTSHADTEMYLRSGESYSNKDFTQGLPGVVCADPESPDAIWKADDPATELIDQLQGMTMRLKAVRIRGFRSIQEEVQLIVDKNVTVLIGANDHGKSNVLAAVGCLNDDRPFTAEDVNWDSDDQNSPVIEWDFEIAIDELAPISAATPKLGVTISKPETVGPISLPSGITFVRSGLSGAVSIKQNASNSLSRLLQAALLRLRPRVELFRAQDKVFDSVSLAELDSPTHEFMKGLFIKAGLWEGRSKIFAQNPRTARALNDASNRLTETLQREWEQGRDLKWKLEHIKDGGAIRLHIEDPAVSTQWVQPSQRSSGFTAFFALSLTTFARTSSQKAREFIYLFDEPGTYLHPVAQINLQRVFEALAEKHQLIYTTHSMFLVNKNNPKRNRVVRKTDSGTNIDSKPFSGNWKAVRESLGILLAHNFLISDYTLLVEGPSDPIYVLSCLGKLVQSGLIDIDLNDFSIMDGGDERNYVAMAKIMLDEGRHVVALLDGDSHGKKLRERLEKVAKSSVKSKHLTIHLLPENCSIEDLLISPELYIKSVCDAVKGLVSEQNINYADGYSETNAVEKLRQELSKKGANKTLGRHTEESTATILENDESISKLNVAIRYEDALSQLAEAELIVPQSLSKLINDLTIHLKLHRRKAEKAATV